MAKIDCKYNQGVGFVQYKVISWVPVPIRAKQVEGIMSWEVHPVVMDLAAEQMLQTAGLISPDRGLLPSRSEKQPSCVLNYLRGRCSEANRLRDRRPNKFGRPHEGRHWRRIILDDVAETIIRPDPPRACYPVTDRSQSSRNALRK